MRKEIPIVLAVLGCCWMIGLNLIVLINLFSTKSDVFPILLQALLLTINVFILCASTFWRARFLTTLPYILGISGLGYLLLVFLTMFSIGIFVFPASLLFLLAALLDYALLQKTIQKHNKNANEDNNNQQGQVHPGLLAQLTPKEVEILSLVSFGKSNKEIAVALYISPNTVRHHVHQVLTKLNCSSRGEAAAFAIRQGLVAPDKEAMEVKGPN